MGFAFSYEVDRPVTSPPYTHTDLIFGDPGSLSDVRLKTNAEELSAPQAKSVLMAIAPQIYDRTMRTEDATSQRRIGFIANQVEEAIKELEIENICGERRHQGDMYKTLDYSRLTTILWAVCRDQERRIAALEARRSRKQ